ncbi:hypothetical protein COOONC_18662, partial [Cooperia oncophora]
MMNTCQEYCRSSTVPIERAVETYRGAPDGGDRCGNVGSEMSVREIAEQTGDHEAVRRLQQELEELDSRAERAEKKRCADISAINWINQRNRNKMKEHFLGDRVEIDMGQQDDPFTRKKGLMK